MTVSSWKSLDWWWDCWIVWQVNGDLTNNVFSFLILMRTTGCLHCSRLCIYGYVFWYCDCSKNLFCTVHSFRNLFASCVNPRPASFTICCQIQLHSAQTVSEISAHAHLQTPQGILRLILPGVGKNILIRRCKACSCSVNCNGKEILQISPMRRLIACC